MEKGERRVKRKKEDRDSESLDKGEAHNFEIVCTGWNGYADDDDGS